MLDRADHVIYVEDGKVGRRRAAPRAAADPSRGTPRPSRGGRSNERRVMLPVATGAQYAAYARHADAPAPARAGRSRWGCTRWPRSPGWPRRGCSATWCRASRTAPRPRTSTRSCSPIAGFVVAQSMLIRFAIFVSARLGEQVLAELREEFVDRVLDLPLSHGRAGRHRRPADAYVPGRRRRCPTACARRAGDADRASSPTLLTVGADRARRRRSWRCRA